MLEHDDSKELQRYDAKNHMAVFLSANVSFASTSLWMEVSVVVCEIWPCQQVPARGAQRWHSWEKQPAVAADNFTYV